MKRLVGTTETWQVYGLGGELLAEYAANSPYSSPQKEYGYRNGQLLVTAEVTTGWGTPPTIEDNPLNNPQNPDSFKIKAIHITQLRAAINALRSHYSLPTYLWQKPTASGGAINNTVLISWEPIDELRTALDQALNAPPSPGYAADLAQGQPIKAIHIQELRERVLAEWVSASSTDIRWLVPDHLGTPRMIFDQTGSLANMKRHDYLPFGEELFGGPPNQPGVGGRLTTQGYIADNVRQKFTSKERDNETGLDYFGARYYASIQGRFTLADPLFIELKRLTDPQKLNLYSYVRNNPLILTDPTGLDIQVDGAEACQYYAQLQNSISSFSIGANRGKVIITNNNGEEMTQDELKALGKTLKGKEKELFNTITDSKHHVTIHAIDGATDSGVFFGRSDGNHTGSHTIAFGQTSLLDSPKNAGGLTTAQLVGHETLEGYYESKGESLVDAHLRANKSFAAFNSFPAYDTQQVVGNMVIGVKGNATIAGTKTVERFTLRFDTPVPQTDFAKGKGAPYRAYPVDVEKVP